MIYDKPQSYTGSQQNFLVDNYGFKYDRENETSVLNFMCQKLVNYYDYDSKLIHDNFWSMKLKEWENNSSIDVSFEINCCKHYVYL